MTQTNDGLVNVVSGLGTDRSKRAYNRFAYSPMNDWAHLDAAFQTNWLARAIVEIPAEDMTREWRDIKCHEADEIRQAEDALSVPMRAAEALVWARLYGGAGVLMVTDQPLDMPLDVNRIKKGGLQRLLVFDRHDMQPQSFNTYDVLAENYLRPEYYIIRGGSQRIHWTHFALFHGSLLPLRQRAQTQGWGDSELRICIDDVCDMVAAKDGIAELMQEANVDVIKREGLADELATDQDEAITQRYALFGQMKSIVRLAILDGDETYERNTLSLSGVAPILEQMLTWISGAAKIPVTRLFGTSAKGMNATGEGDETNYNNSIRSKQLTQLDPAMRTLDQVLVRSALGYWPDDYNYVWCPLQQLNALDQANARKAQSDTDMAYLGANVVTISQIQRNLQAAESYQFNSEDIEEQESLEDRTMFEEPIQVPTAAPASTMTDSEIIQAVNDAMSVGISSDAAIRAVTE